MANMRFPSSNTRESAETASTSVNLPFTNTLENINREIGNITQGIAAQLASLNNSYKAWVKNRDDRKREKAKEEKNNDKKRKEERLSLKQILNNLGKDIKNSVSSFGQRISGSISNILSGITETISSALSGIFGDSPISKLLTSPIALAVLGIYAAVQWLSQRFGYKAKEQKRQKLVVDLKSKKPEDLTDEESAIIKKSEEYDTAKNTLADAIKQQIDVDDLKKGKITYINGEGFVDWKEVRNQQREYNKKQSDFNKAADKLIKKRETEAEEAAKRAEKRSKEKGATANVAAANTNVNNNNITNNNTIINQTSSLKSNAVTNKR